MNHIADIILDYNQNNQSHNHTTTQSQNNWGISADKSTNTEEVNNDNSTIPTKGVGQVKQSDNNSNLDIEKIKKQVYSIKNQLDSLLRLINGDKNIVLEITKSPSLTIQNDEKIIEGVFDGEKMIGPDGQEYTIPPNYASKSKLVEGDMMKLTVIENGSFIYKQIGPAKRKRLIGKLEFNQEVQKWEGLTDETKYKVLTASITFYKGKPGDEVVLLVPENGKSDWAAVENVISK